MSEHTWDVIIIGGGPAGSTAATTLRQAGRSVLVLEKSKFPRFHIGESLLPYNRAIFDELGVWSKIQAAGFMVKRGAQFWMGDGAQILKDLGVRRMILMSNTRLNVLPGLDGYGLTVEGWRRIDGE